VADLGKLLIVFGVVLIVLGGLLAFSGSLTDKVPFLGRLPGDIHVQRGNWSFHFPLGTSIVLSVILSLVLNLLFRR
jgi:hypothetical protein